MDIDIHSPRPLLLAFAFAALMAGYDVARAGDAPPAAQAPYSEATGEGVVNTALLRPFPKDTALSVRAWDNSDTNAELAREIESQMRQRGFTISNDSPLVLKFSTAETVGQLSSGPERRLVELSGRAGSGTEDEAQVRLNLFSTDKGGVFNERRATPETKTIATYSLEMTVDRKDGQRIWQGEATTDATHFDRPRLGKLLIPVLLDNIGKTARSQHFGVK